MHNGIAVVLGISAIVHGLSHGSWAGTAALAFGAVLSAVRGRSVRDTFHKTVERFAAAAARTKKATLVVGASPASPDAQAALPVKHPQL
jgi:hypothetical protein